MKKIGLIIILIVCCSSVFAQENSFFINIVKESIHRAKEQSLYSNEIHWDSLTKKVLSQATNIAKYEELKVPLTTLINGLRDHHASFFYNNQRIAYFTDKINIRKTDSRIFDLKTWEVVNYKSYHEFKLLKNTIGYIKIVGIGPGDIKKKAKNIRNKIDSIALLGAKEWILDLRYNGGGNMYPMLESLAPLLGNGKIGGDADLNGNLTENVWQIKSDNFYYGNYLAVKLPKSSSVKSNSKVVVLLSRFTVSSGEVIAVAFKGRKNTFFIGETTGGYTTVNNMEAINSALTMSISVAYYADRNNTVYKENIKPDVNLIFEIEEDVTKDKGILKAIEWLKN